MSAVVTAASSRQAGRERKTTATRIVVSAFGVLAALAGVEHGVGGDFAGSGASVVGGRRVVA